jgi:hypothetical protein
MSQWDYRCFRHHHLLVAMEPDRCHPVKAGARPAPPLRGSGLDRMSPARQGAAMLVRQIGSGALGLCDES